MKTNIVLCLLNVAWAFLGVVTGVGALVGLINAFVGGFLCCAIAVQWVEGKRPWTVGDAS